MSGVGQVVSTDQSLTGLGNKSVSELIDNISLNWISDVCKVSGTVKNISGWTEFSSEDSERSGHFFPWKFAEEYAEQSITCKNRVAGDRQVTLDADCLLVIRLENFKNNKVIIDTGKETFTLDFTGADLK